MSLADAVLEIAAQAAKLLLPGSSLFLLAGVSLGIGLLLAGGRRAAFGRQWLTMLAVGYWLLSLPAVADGFEAALAGDARPLATRQEAGGAELVVVLTGGGVTLFGSDGQVDLPSHATARRMLEAERLYRLLGEPDLLISGGPPPEAGANPESEAMRTALIERGVPAERIRVEAESGSTREQAVRLSTWLAAEGNPPFVLVTSRAHMQRAVGAFLAVGLTPIPSAAGDGAAEERSALQAWLPSSHALDDSSQALRELLALLYYGLRGWLG